MNNNKKYFFIGIGGIGMSSIAKYFLNLGNEIMGYDRVESEIVKNLSKDLTVPSSMGALVKNGEIGLFMLKLVEIIGSDEIKNLDPETLYFINNLLNKGKIKKVRNQILNLTLPLRV